MKKVLIFLLLVSLLCFSALVASAGQIPQLSVMTFVDRASFSDWGPQDETPADRTYLGECQDDINGSLEKLKVRDFSGAIEYAGKIDILLQNENSVLVSTSVAVGIAQRELIKVIAQESIEQSRLDALYQVANLLASKNKYQKCDADWELEDSLFSDAIKIGLKQRDFSLVVRAAHARGYYGDYSQDTEWNTILRELVSLPEMPKIEGLPLIYLEPLWNNELSWATEDSAREIFEILKKHKWKLPGYEVFFTAYHGEKGIYWKVEGIRGPNFYMGFGQIQGRPEWNTNDTAGFGSVVIPGLGAEFYGDGSGPSVYTYTGRNWDSEKGQYLKGPYLFLRDNWVESSLTCSGYNRIALEDLFSSAKVASQNRANKIAQGCTSKSELLSKVSKYFKEVALPEIKAIDSSAP